MYKKKISVRKVYSIRRCLKHDLCLLTNTVMIPLKGNRYEIKVSPDDFVPDNRRWNDQALHNTIVNVKHITGIKIETYNIVVCESSTKVLGVIIIKGEDIEYE